MVKRYIKKDMSGGYWDYIQYRFQDIGDDLEKIVEQNDSEELDEWGQVMGRHYKPETIAKLKQTAKHVRETAKMLQRVDYLLEGDDGEEAFHRRWKADMEELHEQKEST
jgi:hypothetical protein